MNVETSRRARASRGRLRVLLLPLGLAIIRHLVNGKWLIQGEIWNTDAPRVP